MRFKFFTVLVTMIIVIFISNNGLCSFDDSDFEGEWNVLGVGVYDNEPDLSSTYVSFNSTGHNTHTEETFIDLDIDDKGNVTGTYNDKNISILSGKMTKSKDIFEISLNEKSTNFGNFTFIKVQN